MGWESFAVDGRLGLLASTLVFSKVVPAVNALLLIDRLWRHVEASNRGEELVVFLVVGAAGDGDVGTDLEGRWCWI